MVRVWRRRGSFVDCGGDCFQVPKIIPREQPSFAADHQNAAASSESREDADESHPSPFYVSTSDVTVASASSVASSSTSAETEQESCIGVSPPPTAAPARVITPPATTAASSLARARQIAADTAAAASYNYMHASKYTATPNIVALAAAASSSPVPSKTSAAAAKAAADIDLLMSQVRPTYFGAIFLVTSSCSSPRAALWWYKCQWWQPQRRVSKWQQLQKKLNWHWQQHSPQLQQRHPVLLLPPTRTSSCRAAPLLPPLKRTLHPLQPQRRRRRPRHRPPIRN